MPELPDVEIFRRSFEATSLRSRIEEVKVLDASLIRGDSKALRQTVRGQTFRRGRRHGKFLFGELSGGGAVRFHFGMTGFLRCFREAKDAPPHARVVFQFRNRRQLAFDCQRKFGHIGLVPDIEDFLAEKKLGPDALAIDLDTFRQAVSEKERPLKAALMDQSRLAGVGNVYADEILFQARAHPEAVAAHGSASRLRKLYHAMHKVLEEAIAAQADPRRMPAQWLLPHRGEAACPRCKGAMKRKKIGGRTTWFCENCQKR